MNSDQSPSNVRCSASLRKPLPPSLADTPYNSTVVLATMTLNLQSVKFALWCLAAGLRKQNRRRARSARRASHSCTGCSCSRGHGAPHHRRFPHTERDIVLFMGGTSSSQNIHRDSGAPSSPSSFHSKSKDKSQRILARMQPKQYQF